MVYLDKLALSQRSLYFSLCKWQWSKFEVSTFKFPMLGLRTVGIINVTSNSTFASVALSQGAGTITNTFLTYCSCIFSRCFLYMLYLIKKQMFRGLYLCLAKYIWREHINRLYTYNIFFEDGNYTTVTLCFKNVARYLFSQLIAMPTYVP